MVAYMKVQVLASVMNSSLEAVGKKMNIRSDAVIINQCDCYGYEEKELYGRRIRFFSYRERGVGRSRNEGILKAEGDICLFSDEDIVYVDDYEKRIVDEFKKNQDADMLLFNIDIEEARRTYHITKRKRVRWYSCGRYGAVSFAVRRSQLLASGVMFSLLFGGGAKYSNGEDSLFLKEFMAKGYRVFAVPVTIGRETEGNSTWFAGYDQKFFYDRGVLYHFLYGKAAFLMALRFLLAHKEKMCRDVGVKQALYWMRMGIKNRENK